MFSFNTIYASTESSDALCTVLFLAAIVAFARGLGRRGIVPFAIAGVLCGIAMQFRPNLILVPLLLAGYAIGTAIGKVRSKPEAAGDRDRLWTMAPLRTFAQGLILLGCAGAVVAPWIVRNYRLTAMLLPTSVHGAVQLWYGTLQVGPALHSRAAQPALVFEAPAFDYTSLERVPRHRRRSAQLHGRSPRGGDAGVLLDRFRSGERSGACAVDAETRRATFHVRDAAAEGSRRSLLLLRDPLVRPAPPRLSHDADLGAQAPYVYFVSDDHLGDLDRHSDLLDIFDVVRLCAARGVGRASARRGASCRRRSHRSAHRRPCTSATTRRRSADRPAARVRRDGARLAFADGSSVLVPHLWHQRITDLTFTEGVASSTHDTHRVAGPDCGRHRPVSSDRSLHAVRTSLSIRCSTGASRR